MIIVAFFVLAVLGVLYSCSWNNPYVTSLPSGATPGWYRDFEERTSGPVTASTTYYPCVLYDANHFGNSIGELIRTAGTDTYTVFPYYKMWVGDGNNTDFGYSNDGINWVFPTDGDNVVTAGYHPTVVYSATSFFGENKNNALTHYRFWTWDRGNMLVYYESENGADFAYANKTITNALGFGSAPVYSIAILYRPASAPKYEGWIDNNGRVYYINSNDCMDWQADVIPPANCVMHSGKTAGGSFDTPISTGGWASVVFFNGRYTIWYSSDVDGIGGYPNYNKGISYAESTNGWEWTLVDVLPYMGVNGTPAGPMENAILYASDGNIDRRNNRTYTPTVIYDAVHFSGAGENKAFKMWFTGDGSAYGRRIWYASFNEP
ncbi:MAG: hypothetical protein JW969_07025 [Spirochaetales bacterium]|nr:hypothetical protein [Spirochaetales bacterium]